jgi:hypothetical protein
MSPHGLLVRNKSGLLTFALLLSQGPTSMFLRIRNLSNFVIIPDEGTAVRDSTEKLHYYLRLQ